MAGKKKLSKREFARRFADIAEKSLGSLPAEEQERRITAFERAVSRVCGGENSKPSRNHQTPSIPLYTRARE